MGRSDSWLLALDSASCPYAVLASFLTRMFRLMVEGLRVEITAKPSFELYQIAEPAGHIRTLVAMCEGFSTTSSPNGNVSDAHDGHVAMLKCVQVEGVSVDNANLQKAAAAVGSSSFEKYSERLEVLHEVFMSYVDIR